MTDLQLFDPAPAGRVRASDPVSSVAAARKQRGGAEAAVMHAFERGPMTDDEVAWVLDVCGFYGPTVKSARSRLSRAGLLVDSGEKRDSSRGVPSIVWKLEDK